MTRRGAARAEQPSLLGDATEKVEPAKPKAKSDDAPKAEPPKKTEQQKNVVLRMDDKLPAPTSQNLLSAVFSAIVDPRVDVEKVKGLKQVRDDLMREQAEVAFQDSYIAMKADLPVIRRDGKLDQGTTRSGRQGVTARYASYENIMDSVTPKLREHGFGMIVLPEAGADGTGIVVRGTLSKVCETEFGRVVHTIKCAFPVPNDPTGGKSPPQGVGSAVKYGMRYAAIALLGIVSHDPTDADAHDGKKTRKPAEGEEITAKQLESLRKALEYCGATEEEFCKHYKLAKLEDLPATMLPEALKACADRADRESKSDAK